MTSIESKYSSWPCPHCASFKQIDSKMLSCEECGEKLRKSQYRIAIEYAEFVYRFGHLFRSVYEKQLAEDNRITPVSFEKSHPIALGATLVTLSALHGPNTNWFLTKQTVKRMCNSYNETFDDDIILEDSELRNMNRNIREFTHDFSESDTRLRNAVFEEIFAEYCPRQEHEKLLRMQQQVREAKEADKIQLEKEFDSVFQKVMTKTFKKVSKLPKPEPTELNSYWSKVLKMM